MVLRSAIKVSIKSVDRIRIRSAKSIHVTQVMMKTSDSHQEPGPDDVDDDPNSEKDGKYPVCRLHRQNENMSVSRVDRCGI